jgi:hypothetical protein
MARSRRIKPMSRPSGVSGAVWRELRRDYRDNAREFNRQGRALQKTAKERLREVAKRVRVDERARVRETRAALRALRKAKLFEPPRSAFNIFQTKRGPRRVVKRTYLRRSPKLKAALEQHPQIVSAVRETFDIAARLRRRLLGLFPNAETYPNPFGDLRHYSPAFLAQIDRLSDADLNEWIRVKIVHGDEHLTMLEELQGEEPTEFPSVHPLYYKRKRTIVGLRA